MMGRLFDALVALFVHLFAAILIGEIVVGIHLWIAWGMTPDRVAAMIAVARGDAETDEAKKGDKSENDAKPEPKEEPSYEDVLERRALEYRDLELRDMALKTGLQDLALLQKKITQEKQLVAQQAADFQSQIAALRQKAQDEGMETVRRTLESIKPDQARLFILDMLDKGEEDQVVQLLKDMNDSKRAKLLAEFQTPEDTDKMADVLRRIREGGPEGEIAKQAEQALGNLTPSGS
ncbi:hypothetical protein [Thermostilla marina]